MIRFIYLFLTLFYAVSFNLTAQQIADINYAPPVFQAKYKMDNGPVIMIDEAHNNFHTANGRYASFAGLLVKDGFRIRSGKKVFSKESLKHVNILVIANALHIDNQTSWKLPTPSAFTKDEIRIITKWVREGGSLFLIADHMPFAGAAADLAASFGFRFYNGFAFDTVTAGNYDLFTRAQKNLLSNEISDGISKEFYCDSIVSFTGQGFDIPENASSIIQLNDHFKIYLPEQAWKFDTNTTKINAMGKSQGAYMNFGKGKLVVFGEAAMFTAQMMNGNKIGMNSENAYNNYKLVLNILRWLFK